MLFETLFFGAYFLFLFQLLGEFIAAIYAFGLLKLEIPPELGAVVFLLSPLLLAIGRPPRPWAKKAALVVMVLSRLALPWLSTRGTLWVAGVGTAAGLFALPWLLRRAEATAATVGLGLAVAVAGSLRALGAGVDASLMGSGQALAWIVAGIAFWAWRRAEAAPPPAPEDTSATSAAPYGLALGITSIFFLLFAAETAPAVLARWAEWPPLWAYYTVALALFGWCGACALGLTSRLSARAVGFLLGLHALLLGWGIAHWQTPFPTSPAAYPFPRPALGFDWPLWLAVLLFPGLLVGFRRMTIALQAQRPSLAALGRAWGVGGLYLLLLILAQVFTTTYDYIPVVGPWWRNRFWVVYALPAAVAAWAAWKTPSLPTARPRTRGPLVAALATVAMLLFAVIRAPRFAPPPPDKTLHVVTYNIQQGYRADGEKGWEDQLAVLSALRPDVIALEESDTARLSGANNDLVGYFASALHMEAIYGPPTVDGTFGIALLSRWPVVATQTIYLYSQGEQTALLWATLQVHESRVTIAVTHLGNGGPIIQQKEVLSAIADRKPLVLLGDFNFRPDTPQYRLTLQTLQDANPSPAPDEIDHVFITSDLQVLSFQKVTAAASDHPALAVVLTFR